MDYFATPEPLGLKMVEWADASTGDAMLEPSAGHGAIARWFPEDTRNTFVEPSRELSVQLGLSARHGKILDHDFETLHVTNKYDAIVMNPPFGSGGATAIAHLGKAAGHLKNGGRIVVLYPEGPAADKRMSAFLEKTDNLYTVAEFGLPPVVFERAGTTAKTRVLVLEKQLNADDAPNGQGRIDLNADTIGEFFDKIRDLSVKPRNKPTKAAELEPATAPITPAARGTVNDLLARSDESWLTAKRRWCSASIVERRDQGRHRPSGSRTGPRRQCGGGGVCQNGPQFDRTNPKPGDQSVAVAWHGRSESSPKNESHRKGF